MSTKYTKEYNENIARQLKQIMEKTSALRKFIRAQVVKPPIDKDKYYIFLMLEALCYIYYNNEATK